MRICVYGASSPTIDVEFFSKTQILGEKMALRGHSLVFGGGAHGLMGSVATGVRNKNGKILGVIPKFFDEQEVEVVYNFCDKLIKPDTMRERKQIMEENSDAFIVLPGGVGTFEEFFEILTLKQLCRHNKPIAIFNINGYYNEIIIALTKAVEKNFIRKSCLALFNVFDDVDKLLDYIEKPVTDIKSVKEFKDG